MRLRKIAVLLPLLVGAATLAVSLGGCKAGLQPASDLPEPSGAATSETTETSIFYATGRTLLQEKRVVETATMYESTLEELLLASPEKNTDVAIVQPAAEFISITVDEGLATIDWTADILDFEAEPGEKRIALASILATMGQFNEVEKVQFLVEGKTEGDIEGKDIAAFWGDVTLKNQPWDAIKVKGLPSGETTTSTSPTSTQ